MTNGNGEPEEVRIGSRSFEQEQNKVNNEDGKTSVDVEVERSDRLRTDNYCRIELGMDEIYELTEEQKRNVIESVLKSDSGSSQRSRDPGKTGEQDVEVRNQAAENRPFNDPENSKTESNSEDHSPEENKPDLEDTDRYQGPLNIRQRILAAFAIGLITGVVAMLVLTV